MPVRATLDLDAAKLIGHALVSSRLDYCNSILYGRSRTFNFQTPESPKCLGPCRAAEKL